MADIGRITFGPNHGDPLYISPEELRFMREPGFTIERPPIHWTTRRNKQTLLHIAPDEFFIGGTSCFAAVQDEE